MLHKNTKTEGYSEPSQTSKIGLLYENSQWLRAIFLKSFILDMQLGFEYISEKRKEFRSAIERTIKSNTERAKQF